MQGIAPTIRYVDSRRPSNVPNPSIVQIAVGKPMSVPYINIILLQNTNLTDRCGSLFACRLNDEIRPQPVDHKWRMNGW